MDDFEELKARVDCLRHEVPSQRGCLARLEAEGISGPIAEAAVEAVFNDAKDAARQRYEDAEGGRKRSGSKFGRSLGNFVKLILLGCVAFVPGTLLAGQLFPDAGFLSVVHLLCVGGVLLAFKLGAALYTSLFG